MENLFSDIFQIYCIVLKKMKIVRSLKRKKNQGDITKMIGKRGPAKKKITDFSKRSHQQNPTGILKELGFCVEFICICN